LPVEVRSLPDELKKPRRPDHVSPECLCLAPKLSIRGDESDHWVRGARDGIKKCLIAIAVGMEDENPIDEATGHTLASLALQDHRDWRGNPP
jgi:hypothetical protein